MRGRAVTICVFLVSLTILTWHAGRAGIATSYVDPIDKITAQAEAMYAAGTFEMADHGDWLTPRFAGRYALWKPPILNWLSAASVLALGKTALAIRLPSIVAGAATVTLVFWWLLAEGATTGAALTGAILLLSSHLFFILSRVAMMDVLLTFEITVAMFALARDRRLASRASLWMFGGAVGAAIMTKAVAGSLPLIILVVLCVVSRERPSLARLAQAVAIIVAIALPWHLYQLIVHPRWFWDEYILTETLAYGLKSPPQDAQEPQLAYYSSHVFLLDPVLVIGGLAALIWKRSRVLIVWILVVFGAALVFQYRNDAYLTPLYPALAILAVAAIPRKVAPWTTVLACALFAGKIISASQPWGLPFEPETTNPSIAALDRYAALHRPNDLLVVEVDDNFYSADLGLPHVRYVWIDPAPPRRFPMDFQYLGILISAAEYARMPELRAEFERRARAENLNSSDPIPTTILAHNAAELRDLIRTHPEVDFFLPAEWISADQGVHLQGERTATRGFLLAR
jgi:Dolichyl-phosphate-mannose-protein mannosyltransferase